VQSETVEPDSDAVEELWRYMAPPVASLVELVAVQSETVESDSDAFEE
jgi:hypothetical protein